MELFLDILSKIENNIYRKDLEIVQFTLRYTHLKKKKENNYRKQILRKHLYFQQTFIFQLFLELIQNLVNRNVSFVAFNYPEHYISYDGKRNDVKISKKSENVFSNWSITPGLCGKGISFKALWTENSYLRYLRQNGFITAVNFFENTHHYKLDACFLPIEGMVKGGQISFASVNYTGFYLRHKKYKIKLHQYNANQSPEIFKEDSTFNITYL